MKKMICISCLSLGLLACTPQTSGNTPQTPGTPTASAAPTAPEQAEAPAEPLPAEGLSYTEAVRASFNEQQRSQARHQAALFEDARLMQHTALGMAISGTAPLPTAPMMADPSDSAPLSATEEAEALQTLKNLFQGQSESLGKIQQTLQTLTPPPDFVREHQQILAYLTLQQQLGQDMLRELEQQGLALMNAAVPEHLRDKMQQLQLARTAAQQALASLEIERIQQSFASAETAALSPEAWQERLNSLIADPGQFSYGPIALALLSQPGEPEQKQRYLTESKQRWQQQLSALQALTPPDSAARSHAALIGVLQLDLEIMQALPEELLTSTLDPRNSLAAMAALYAQPEVVEKMFWLSALLSEVRPLLLGGS